MSQTFEQPESNDEEMTVTLDLEDGSSVECAIVTILTVNNQDYIVLLPLDENGENEDGEVWFYRYSENENDPNEEPVLDYIDDDNEYEAVADAFDEFLDTQEFDEITEQFFTGSCHCNVQEPSFFLNLLCINNTLRWNNPFIQIRQIYMLKFQTL